MKVKLDENILVAVGELLRQRGIDVDTTSCGYGGPTD